MFYDPNAEFQDTEYRELPPGEYIACAVQSVWKPSKKGDMMMEVDFQVLKGEMESVQIRHWFNLGSSNDTAKEIAMKDLFKLCRAIGLTKPIESEDDLVAFFNWAATKPVKITVKHKADREGQMRPRLVGFDAPDKAQAPAAQAAAESVKLPPAKKSDDIPF